MFAGKCLNDLVMLANGQLMPVYDAACPAGLILDRNHFCGFPNSHLKFLADYIHWSGTICSPGDFLLKLGSSFFVVFLILFLYFVAAPLTKN